MTLPAPTSELPANWAAFVDGISAGLDPIEAARGAGIANPEREAGSLLRHPLVRNALVEASHAKLQTRGVQLAWDVIEEIMTDRAPQAKAVRAKMAIALTRVKSRLVK